MSAPSTPISTFRPGASTPDTGSWRHPAMDVIVQRNKFKGDPQAQLRRLYLNSTALVFSLGIVQVLSLSSRIRNFASQPSITELLYYANWLLYFLRLLFAFNTAEAFLSLTRKDPDHSDLPLTPEQRKLLGLNPNVPSSSKSGYITPPRYPRSSPSSSTRGSPTLGHSTLRNSSPIRSLSPTRSALFSPTVGNDGFTTFHSPSPSPLRQSSQIVRGLGVSELGGSIFNSPSPKGVSSGSSIPVGNRWIYDKMGKKSEGLRFSPGKSSLFSSFASR